MMVTVGPFHVSSDRVWPVVRDGVEGLVNWMRGK